MALDGKDLGKKIRDAVFDAARQQPAGDADPAELDDYRESIYEEMGKAIVKYIQDNADVYGVVILGVKPGPAARGQGQTTGKVR
jgi:hypothetical protein